MIRTLLVKNMYLENVSACMAYIVRCSLTVQHVSTKEKIMNITKELLQKVARPGPAVDLQELAELMNKLLPTYDILSKEQVCSFIAQLCHESGGFHWLTELGGHVYFDKYEPSTSIGKMLGNTEPGDGERFKGRGLLQITGRYNVMEFGKWYKKETGNTFEIEELSKLPLALYSSLWYWKKLHLEKVKDLKRQTKLINGGLTGYQDRLD